MDQSPLVSIIVPNYNYEAYIDERMQSILAQTFTDYEIILLDDASTDGSAAILQKYSEDCPKVSAFVINETNTGSPFAQWQRGVSLARGKYIWIAEADDSASPHFLQSIIPLMEADSEAVLALTGSTLVDENGSPTGHDYDEWTSRFSGSATWPGKKYVANNMYHRNRIYNASMTVFRRDAFVSDSKAFTMRYCGDWMLWVDIAYSGKVIEIYQKLNIFRRHSNCTTRRGERLGQSWTEALSIARHIEQLVHIPFYPRHIRRGEIFKYLRRMDPNMPVRAKGFDFYRNTWGNPWPSYLFERASKIVTEPFPRLKASVIARLKP